MMTVGVCLARGPENRTNGYRGSASLAKYRLCVSLYRTATDCLETTAKPIVLFMYMLTCLLTYFLFAYFFIDYLFTSLLAYLLPFCLFLH